MPTQITQLDEEGGAHTTLRIAGSLTLADAELIARICAGLHAQRDVRITLDLGDLDFLDSESAAVLARLQEQHGVALDGVHLFVQQLIDQTEQGRD
jgi:anti-anti-sigma factor